MGTRVLPRSVHPDENVEACEPDALVSVCGTYHFVPIVFGHLHGIFTNPQQYGIGK